MEFLVLPVVLIAFGLIFLKSMVLVISQKTAKVVERFGRFHDVKQAGLRVKAPWPIDTVVGVVNLRVRELRANVSVKTQDNVFVTLPVAVQYVVDRENVAKAFYELDNPEQQIESYILAKIRSEANSMDFDELYSDKDKIQTVIEQTLGRQLYDFGYTIKAVLVDEPQPTEDVVDAFNRVIAAKRAQDAASMEGEALKIKFVKEAEGVAESKRLQGTGIAQQRIEIARGFAESIDELKKGAPNVDESLLLAFITMTNQWETIRDASNNEGTTILLPYAGDGSIDDMRRMVKGMAALGGQFKD